MYYVDLTSERTLTPPRLKNSTCKDKKTALIMNSKFHKCTIHCMLCAKVAQTLTLLIII